MRRLTGILAIIILCISGQSALVRAWVSSGHTWGTTQVPYYVNPNNLYVSQQNAIAAIQSAAANWSTQSNASVQLVYAGQTNDASLALNYVNEVFFRNDTSGAIAETYWWYDGTGHLVDSDTVFHENYKFYTGNVGCNSDGYYIENVGTHEFGHALGLQHSSVPTATMWPSGPVCQTDLESLDPDDVTGIQAIYPPSTNQPPTAPSQLVVAANASNPTGALSLGWVNTAANANGYRVNRSSDGVNFGQVAQLGSSASSYTDGGLASGATYFYQVYAYNSAGSSGSNMASGQTQAVATAPAAPSNPSPSNGATGVSTSATLTWTCSGAQSYDVYINGALYASNLTGTSVPTTLSASTQYSWSVVAKNGVGSTQGPTWSFTTKAATTAPVPKGKGRK